MASISLEPLPHREAISYFRSKGYAPQLQRFHHLDHFREEHARNFVVAKAMQDDVLIAIREEFDRAFAEGRTLKQFQEDLAPRLEEMGWWGKSIARDPVNGEMTEVQLGSMRRLRTIFDTNMRTSHAAGHWARIQRTKAAFPYLEYVQIERPSKRHDHERFHGKIWAVDDPVWLRIYPPNGFFCGCTVRQLTAAQLVREGKAVSDPVDLEEEPWTNKRTGEVSRLPKGVHPGFDSNPGATWLDLGAAWQQATPDLEPAARASGRGIVEGLRLQQIGYGREAVVIADHDGRPVNMRSAGRGAAAATDVSEMSLPEGASILRSQPGDSALSGRDVEVLHLAGARSITAVSAGGSLWRAVRGDVDPGPALGRWGGRADDAASLLDGVEQDTADIILQHALMLWLERQGVITYHPSVSARVAQILATYAELILRLAT